MLSAEQPPVDGQGAFGPKRRRLLMIAFHFPPMKGSSGLQRTLTFANHLSDAGWDVRVLTASAWAYPDSAEDQLNDVRRRVQVSRAWCLDAARHLSVNGKYPRFVAVPDRWASWIVGAVPVGLWCCIRWRPSLIWSTFPIATSHRIAGFLHRLAGVPWIADFRDSMTETEYPSDPKVRHACRRIEQDVVQRASACHFTAMSTLAMYQDRYPEWRRESWAVIPNGYDDEAFEAAEKLAALRPPTETPKILLHSGLLDPTDRDPVPFFDALAAMKAAGELRAGNVCVVLRATGHDETYRTAIASRGIADIVYLAPPLPYVEALAEMLAAHGLLLFQASCCNHQIPAKLYEYFRARRPVLCVTDPMGDTAAEARAAGVNWVLPCDDAGGIRMKLREFLDGRVSPSNLISSAESVSGHSRRAHSVLLARHLESVLLNEKGAE